MQTGHSKTNNLPGSAFDLAPNPRFFYANRVYQEAFLALRYAIKLRKGLVILTGQSGTGKTSLIALIKDRRESNTRLAVVSNAGEESWASLKPILRALGLTETLPERQAQVAEIRRYSVEQLRQNHIVALIVDRAHELDLDALQELESLSNLNLNGQRLLQIVLVGRPELETKLANPALESFRRRVAVWCRVEPLQMDEVGAYIDHRLACAGHQQGELFQSSAVERIAAYSKGVPGLINTICQKALFSDSAGSCPCVTAETIDGVWETLQRTGETEFEVAVLLSEIRRYSRPAEKHAKAIGANANGDSGPGKNGRFSREDAMSGGEETANLKMRKKGSLREGFQRALSWLAALSHRGRQQITDGSRMLHEQVRQSALPQLGILPGLTKPRRTPRWLGWSAVAAVLLVAGAIAAVFEVKSPRPGPESHDKRIVRQQGQTRQAANVQEGTEPAIDGPAAVHEVDELGDLPQLQQAPALRHPGIREDTGDQRIHQDNFSTQTLSSWENTTATETAEFARIVYVHTSEEHDRSVLDEIGNVLRIDGYSVRGTRFSSHQTRGDVRFFFPRDRHDAERVKSVVQSELGKRGYSLSLQLLERDGSKFEHAAPGKIEVWLPPLSNVQRTG